jgi:hypothetical protein
LTIGTANLNLLQNTQDGRTALRSWLCSSWGEKGAALLVYNQMPEAAQDSFKMVIMKMKAASMPSIADVRELLLRRKYSCEISEAICGSGAPVGGIVASLCGTLLFLLVAIASCSAAQID